MLIVWSVAHDKCNELALDLKCLDGIQDEFSDPSIALTRWTKYTVEKLT